MAYLEGITYSGSTLVIDLSCVGGTVGTFTIPVNVDFVDPWGMWEEWIEHWCDPQCPCRRPWAGIVEAKQRKAWRSKRDRRKW